jgi:hypothetical protein
MSAPEKQPTRATGLAARREQLRIALRAFDDAIARSPDNELLKQRRARLARELRMPVLPGELTRLRERLAEIEAAMGGGIMDYQRATELLRARERLLADITEIERWANPST